MKRRWWGLAVFVFASLLTLPVSAIETAPSTPNKTVGPFLITGYSFSGSTLRYVQIFNNSQSLSSLDGWRLVSSTKAAPIATTQHVTLAGSLEPGDHIIAAIPNLVDRVAFEFAGQPAAPGLIVGSVSLQAPSESLYGDETVAVPNITSSTPRINEGADTFYVKREVSSSTGNYLSGFSFMVPSEPLKNDQLYLTPMAPGVSIVEVYPDAVDCPPFDPSPLCADYVKLHNQSSSVIDLSGYRLRTGTYGQAASTTNTKVLQGALMSGAYVTVSLPLSTSGSWVWLEDRYGAVVYEATMLGYPSGSGQSGNAWSYDIASGNWEWTPTPTPFNEPNRFPAPVSVNSCFGLVISEIAANVTAEAQFVELYNAADEALNLTGCALQTNRSSSTTFALGDETLAAGEYVTVPIKGTGLTLTKTTSGTVYLLSSDLNTEVDSVPYETLAQESSYALVGDTWLQTFAMTPGVGNIWQQYPDCEAGYIRNFDTGYCNKIAVSETGLSDCGPGKYRSPDTNRCRSLEALATALTPCDAGQYRNPDTNRCRSLVSAASALTPCGPGQERNPDTNRCRNTASGGGLQPCAANQERNPDTNRCRNSTIGTTADFPVEAVAQSGQATLGWWAFGGIGLLAAGYAGWEWRHELVSAIRRMGSFAKLGR